MTLYAVRQPPGTSTIEDAEVVDEFKYGWGFLEQAVTLWRLVDTTRADQINAIMDRVALAAGDGELRIEADDLRELVSLLSGVEDAIVAAEIVDNHWRVPAERLEDLAKQVPAMDLKTERPLENKTSALGEVMINAGSIRNFLSNAVREGCIVVLA
jgi:ATP phosphoribosyltransferase